MVKVCIKTRVRATENPDKVVQAILNIFPDAINEEGNGDDGEDKAGSKGMRSLTYRSTDVGHLKKLIRDQKIRDSARSMLLNSVKGDTIRFDLNKQVAFVRKISFAVDGAPLGPLRIKITCEDGETPEELVSRLTYIQPDQKEEEK